MANFEISTTPTFNLVMRQLESTDPAAAEIFNVLFAQLLENDAFIDAVISNMPTLDENGKIPSSQLPSYVDDVLEFSSKSSFPSNGETGKIYVDASTNKTYRWSGTAYVEISASLALGETSATAYRGDRGKVAYEHSQTVSGNPHRVTASDIGALTEANVVNNLTSTSTTNALSANQGRILANKLGDLSFVPLTQGEYDALEEYDSNTLYIITE